MREALLKRNRSTAVCISISECYAAHGRQLVYGALELVVLADLRLAYPPSIQLVHDKHSCDHTATQNGKDMMINYVLIHDYSRHAVRVSQARATASHAKSR